LSFCASLAAYTCLSKRAVEFVLIAWCLIA
jgi:hypothetical protein